MARHQATPYSPIAEHELEGQDPHDDLSTSGCNCFHFFPFKWSQNNGNEHGYASGDQRETWVGNKLRKVKEVSEVVAGPKWKTFIRKISGYIKKTKNQKNNQFQYDPESYALNFDREEEEEEELLVPIFSSRFSAAPSADRKHQNGFL